MSERQRNIYYYIQFILAAGGAVGMVLFGLGIERKGTWASRLLTYLMAHTGDILDGLLMGCIVLSVLWVILQKRREKRR